MKAEIPGCLGMDTLHFGPLFNICCLLFPGPQFFHTFCQTDFSIVPSFNAHRLFLVLAESFCTSQCSTATPFDLFSEGPNSNQKVEPLQAELVCSPVLEVYRHSLQLPPDITIHSLPYTNQHKRSTKQSSLRMLFQSCRLYTAKRHQ